MTTPSDAAAAPSAPAAAPAAPAASGTPAAPAAAPAPAVAPVQQDERYGSPEKGYATPKDWAQPAELTTALHGLGKDLNLSDKAMEKVYAVANAHAHSVQSAFDAAHSQNLATWKADSAKDSEFGGEKFSENRAVALKGMEYIAEPKLREILKESGLEDHPEFFRVFYRVGKLVSEDRIVRGTARPAGDPGTFTYGNSDHK